VLFFPYGFTVDAVTVPQALPVQNKTEIKYPEGEDFVRLKNIIDTTFSPRQ